MACVVAGCDGDTELAMKVVEALVATLGDKDVERHFPVAKALAVVCGACEGVWCGRVLDRVSSLGRGDGCC